MGWACLWVQQKGPRNNEMHSAPNRQGGPRQHPSQAARVLGERGFSQPWLGAQGADLDQVWSQKMYVGAVDLACLSGTSWRGYMGCTEDRRGTSYLYCKPQLASGTSCVPAITCHPCRLHITVLGTRRRAGLVSTPFPQDPLPGEGQACLEASRASSGPGLPTMHNAPREGLEPEAQSLGALRVPCFHLPQQGRKGWGCTSVSQLPNA